MSGAGSEFAGYCAHHRAIVTWRTRPALRDALCPIDGCGMPLCKRPRASSLGRHTVRALQPTTRERRALVVRDVEETTE